MSETVSRSNIPAFANGLRGRVRMALTWMGRVAVLIGGVAATAWVWRSALASLPPGEAWLLVQAPLCLCCVILAWRFAAQHERKWVRPARQLARLIDEAKSGQTPIESLSEVSGPIAALARQVQELLHDLRREQQNKARIQAELSQRVRNRTGAIESKIALWQSQAYRDPLTGLSNRRHLDEHLPKLLEQSGTEGGSLCVLAIDMDNFKKVNDTLGHSAGDKLLRDLGQIIRSTLRETDLAFRTGGDEFLILLPNNDAKAGLILARRLTALVDQLAVTVRSEPKPGLSVGTVYLRNLRSLSAAGVLEQADAAMYQEKQARKTKK